LSAYGIVGGYPAAVRDFLSAGEPVPRDNTVRIVWDIISGDIARSGRDPVAALKLLEEVAVCLGNPLKWTGAARAMGVSDTTARQYVEHLAESFALLAVYYWDLAGGTLEPGRQRKVYFIDPLLGTIPSRVMPGARTPPPDGIVENLVALGLFRSAAQPLIQAGPVPGSIAYWRSTRHREIDFVVPVGSGSGRMPVEVKGDSDSGIGHARLAIRRSFGRGIVVSRSVFDWADDVPVIPVSVFLASLAERSRRGLSVA
jgi:predicted AAA+ superfamily ATPase